MIVLLYLLALAMMVVGAASGVFGAPHVQQELGWTMVIAGSVVATGGAILLGLTYVAQSVRLLERSDAHRPAREPQRAGRTGAVPESPQAIPAVEVDDGRLTGIGAAASEAPRETIPSLTATPDTALHEDPPIEASPVEEEAAATVTQPSQTVVGTYASGGNEYVMYSDGSIHADTPTGHYRFASLEELKAFVASGGERHADDRPT